MDYRDILDSMRDTMSREEFIDAICRVCVANIKDIAREEITAANRNQLMYAVVLYGDYMKAYLQSTMPPAWGESPTEGTKE